MSDRSWIGSVDWVGIMFFVFLTITVPTCIYSGGQLAQEEEKTKQLELKLKLDSAEGDLIDGQKYK